MRLLFTIIGLFLIVAATNADWLAYQPCRDRWTWGAVTVDNGNCVPGYFDSSLDRLLVSCGSGDIGVFRCTSKDCLSGCSQIKRLVAENGKCSNDTADGNGYKYFCSIDKPDFGHLVGKSRFLSAAYFPANTTGWCAVKPWRYEIRPVGECYPMTYRDNYQAAVPYEDYSAQLIFYKDPSCQSYRSQTDYRVDECLKPDSDLPAQYWSFQKSVPPKE